MDYRRSRRARQFRRCPRVLVNEQSSIAGSGGEVLAQRLWERYPQVYHMAEAGSWLSIQKHGLLSTSALLDLFEWPHKDRIAIEAHRRPNSITLTHPIHGVAVIRDQKPLIEKRLASCLRDGITVEQWLRLLNGRVFFWLEESRLGVLRGAQAYRAQRQLVPTADTRRLVEAHADQILLTPINTGATRSFAAERGQDTFSTIEIYPFETRRKVVELTIERGVENIAEYVLKAEELGGGQGAVTIWSGK